MNTTLLTQLEFDAADCDKATKIAGSLGYTQLAYTSSSSLIGYFCLAENKNQKPGCIIKTKELGFLFVQPLEDLGIQE